MLIGLSFFASLAVIVTIGALAARVASPETSDYLLAGRKLPPWLLAFSSAATNNSGYMFIGLVGYTYTSGLEAVWLQLGWMFGDGLAWKYVHLPVRRSTGDIEALSVPAWLGTTPQGRRVRAIVVIAALLTFLFLAGYAAAQLKAGSAGLSVMFGFPESVGVCLSAGIVVLYCFSGGFRASVWTDAAQSFVMIFSMLLLVGVAWFKVGGLSVLFTELHRQDPSLVDVLPTSSLSTFGLFIVGYVVGGSMAVAQPHILTRTIALRSVGDFVATRRYYFLWLIPFSILTLLVGLFARVLLPELTAGDAAQVASSAEHALPVLSHQLLPDILVGVILSGIFAATMSTADSQILTCSAAITQDIAPRFSKSYWAGKVATISVAALAVVIALTASEGVFKMVLTAWSVLGAALGPLILVRITGRVPRPVVSVMMMLCGAAITLAWKALGYGQFIYEIVPGMLAAAAILAAFWIAPGRSCWATTPSPATARGVATKGKQS